VLYDQGLDPEMAPGAGDDPFQDFAKEYYKAGKGRKKPASQEAPQNIHRRAEIEFEQAVLGTKVVLEIEKSTACSTCNGTRCRPGTAPVRCPACGGSGSTPLRQGPVVLNMPCHKCDETGMVIKSPCEDCRGEGRKTRTTREEVSIPPGVEDKQVLVVRGLGHTGPDGSTGELHLEVGVRPSPYFTRRGQDLHCFCWVNVPQAALGAQLMVKTLTGEQRVEVRPGAQDGDCLKLQGLGVPRAGGRGDQVVVIKVSVPRSLTPRQRQLYEELLRVEGQGKPAQEESSFSKFRDMFK
jgi:molecular chaperone DnaJ